MPAGTRSWTDATTSSIFFHGVDSAEYLKGLMQGNLKHGTLLAGPFLHEFTHHWCNRTLLGAALALTEIRLLIFTEAYPDGRPIWARDFAAHRTMQNLLRPMAEGLAQIAEYNLTHIDGDSRRETPLGVATLCFGASAEDMYRHAMLQFLRHSSELLDRKASLYFKKFEVEDGYLPGYMTAINIIFSILRRGYNVPFELFLVYLRSYFWDDPVLVNILLSDETDGQKLAGLLIERFNARLWALHISPDLPERIQSFWKTWNPEAPAPSATLLGCNEQDFATALERIGRYEQHYHMLVDEDEAAVERITGMPAAATRGMLLTLAENRRYAVIATAEVLAQEDGRFSLISEAGSEDISALMAKCDTVPPGLYELSAVVPSFGSFVAILLSNSEGYVQGVREIQAPGIDDGIRQSTIRFVVTRHHLSQVLEQLRDRFSETGIKILQANALDRVLEGSHEAAMEIYAAAAAARFGTGAEAAKIRETLRANGLRTIFGNDPVLARLVAGMSMLSVTDQRLQQRRDLLVKWTQLYYLPDYTEEDLQKRLDAMLARDTDGLVIRQIDEFLWFYV